MGNAKKLDGKFDSSAAETTDELAKANDTFINLVQGENPAVLAYMEHNTDKACQQLDALSQSSDPKHHELVTQVLENHDNFWHLVIRSREADIVQWINRLAPQNKERILDSNRENRALLEDDGYAQKLRDWKAEIDQWKTQRQSNDSTDDLKTDTLG